MAAALQSGPQIAPAELPLLLSIEATAALLSVSTTTVKRLIAARELVSRKAGRRTLVPRTSIEAFCRKDHQTSH